MNVLCYDSYLGLPRLLSAQRPRVAGDGALAASEHLFIVAHQSSELWAKQCLLDLGRATTRLRSAAAGTGEAGTGEAGTGEALQRLHSAAAGLRMLTANLTALHALPVADFRRIRPLLGSASGIQSTQMAQLMAILGVPRTRSVLFDAFRDLLRRSALSLDEVCADIHGSSPPHRLARSLAEVSRAMTSWQEGHLRIAARFVGDGAGTGGTAGAAYLERRVCPAFPELMDGLGGKGGEPWDAMSRSSVPGRRA